jgi:hypothetical protein
MKLLKASLLLAVLLVIAATAHQIHAVISPTPRQAPAAKVTLAAMPVGVPRWVDFAVDDGAFIGLTPLERRQQLLDWLLFTAASAAGLDQGQVRQLFFDLPPLRRGYLEPLANFDYGEIRSRSLDTGQVIALVPRASALQRLDDLAQIADEQRKETGRIPSSLVVFEYQLDPALRSGTLTRLEAVDGKDLFRARAGYAEAAVTSTPDLQRFLTQVDDVTFARVDGDRLIVGGRKLQARPYRGIALDDVAALWQSEQELVRQQDLIKEFEARWENRTYSTELEKTALEDEHQRDLAHLQAELGQKSGGEHKLRQIDSSGFSLDPAYNYTELGRLYDHLRVVLEKIAAEPGAPFSTDDVAAAGVALRHDPPDEGPFLLLLGKMSRSKNAIYGLLGDDLGMKIAQAPFSFQHARYDGKLRGTRVGMVLFYTDLLAKLWALDYLRGAPRPQDVEDFVPLLRVLTSPVYIEGIKKLNGTRLWFGPQDRGFQAATGSLLLARNATRVYAASSDIFEPGKEAEPNAKSAAFLGWWNDHYEAVARYEPEYERLNEIMKWSLVLGWLEKSGHLDRLSYLAAVRVDDHNWFPDWVKHQELRFHRWDGVRFNDRGYMGVEAESLPILRSADYEHSGMVSYLVGGVSLGGKSLFAERGVLADDVAPLLRRSNLDYSVSKSGQETLTTLGHVRYDITADSVVAKIRPEAKLRDLDVEVPNRPFAFHYDAGEANLAVTAKMGGTPVGRFSVERSGNAFEVAFRDLDYGEMHGLARQLAAQPGDQVASLLAGHPGVDSWIKLAGTDNAYLIRMKASGRWLKLAPEGAPRAEIAPGVDLRTGGWTQGGGERWNMVWARSEDVAGPLRGRGLLEVEVAGGPRAGLAMRLGPRGPPDLEPIDLVHGDQHLRAYARRQDARGALYFKLEELPPALREAPEKLRDFIQPQGVVDSEAALSHLQDSGYRVAAADLARDPAGYKQQLDGLRRQTLADADALLAAGRDAEAGHLLDTAVKIYGADPALLGRRAVAALREGNLARVALDLDEATAAGPAESASVFDAINTHLAAAKLEAPQQQGLLRLSAYADLRQTARTGPVKAAIDPIRTANGTFDFQASLLDRLPPTRPITPGEIRSPRVYVDAEDPSLQNVDWSDPQHPVIDETVSHEITATELQSWEIARALPLVIKEASSGHAFRLASHLPLPGRYVPLRHDPCGDPQRRAGRSDCDGRIYLLSRTAQPRAAALSGSR